MRFALLPLPWSAALLAGLVLAGLASVTRAADAPPLAATPDLALYDKGAAYAMTVLADGSRVVGGYFSSVDGTPRLQIAKLDANGALDPSWNPQFSFTAGIYALDHDAAGRVYVAGSFTQVNGVARQNLVRLLPDGSVDASWQAAADGRVRSLIVDEAEGVFIDGDFGNVDGERHGLLAKLALDDGHLLSEWAPEGAWSIAGLDAVRQQLYVETTSGFTRVATGGSGARDAAWNVLLGTDSPPGEGLSFPLRIAIDSSGRVYAGGDFISANGISRHNLVRLIGANAAVDESWGPQGIAGGYVNALALDDEDRLYVALGFAYAPPPSPDRFLMRYRGDGAGEPDDTWQVDADSDVEALILDAHGCLQLGGTFARVGGASALNLAQLPVTGTCTGTLPGLETRPTVRTIAVQPDGSVFLGGDFHRAMGEAHDGILRLKPDGTLDSGFTLGTDDGVYRILADGAGNAYLGGIFHHVAGQSRDGLAKISLSGAGALDPDWAPRTDGPVYALALDGGDLFVGGDFRHVGEVERDALAKVSATGTGDLDPQWEPSGHYGGMAFSLLADHAGYLYVGASEVGVYTPDQSMIGASLVRLATAGSGFADPVWRPNLYYSGGLPYAYDLFAQDGYLYFVGAFDHVQGVAQAGAARVALRGDGSLDMAWRPTVVGSPRTVAIGADGYAYFGGYQYSQGLMIGSLSRHAIAGDGKADPKWNASVDGRVWALAGDGQGGVYAGGRFIQIAEQSRRGLAKFPGDAIFANGFDAAPLP